MLIVPGLVDIQVNGAFGIDFSDPTADIDRAAAELPRFGVTAFLPTVVTSSLEVYPSILANLRARTRSASARILGVHVQGPFLSPNRAGTHNPDLLLPPDVALAQTWLAVGDVRIVTVAPELPGAEVLIAYLSEQGVTVSMGHSDATWQEAAAGAAAGARYGTHIFNAMRPFRHRDPGIVGYLLASHLPVGFIGDGSHLALETISVMARIKGPDEMVLVTDALAGLGVPPGPFRIAGREYISDGVLGRLPDGTISGSLLPLNLALRNLTTAGIETAAAIKMATLNPARLIGQDHASGRIKVGMPADLAILDGGEDALLTLIGGVVAYYERAPPPVRWAPPPND